jgi:short-subunit dehydrogenase
MTYPTTLDHIVISGASAGIGQALALAYASPGRVMGLVGRDVQRLKSSADACRARGAQVVEGCVDVRDRRNLKSWLDEFDTNYPIDLAIANAGISTTVRNLDGWEGIDKITENIDTNLYGSLNLALPVIERMRSRKKGQVALVASLAAMRGMAISPAYCASKSALKAWGEGVRPLLKHQGVDLSVILPGFVKTAMSDSYPGKKQYVWTAERAATYIRSKLAQRHPEIAFPPQLYFGMRFLALLPTRAVDSIVNKF